MKKSVDQLVPKPLQFLVGREGVHGILCAMDAFAHSKKPWYVPTRIFSAYVSLETRYCVTHQILAVSVVTPFGNSLGNMAIKIDVLTTAKGKKKAPSKSKKKVTK